MDKTEIAAILDYIDPAMLDYQQWVNVGMALKLEGCSVSDWDAWSRRDSRRYHSGECESKWESFNGSSTPVTGGTIVQLAKEFGWKPSAGSELDWNDEIQRDDLVIIDKDWIDGREFRIPEEWNPVQQLITYLDTLFESTDLVGYVTRATKGDGDRIAPSKGCWDRTAGQLIEQLSKCKGDIGAVLGDYNPEYGAWIRFNPLDGQGIKNANVTEFRYALVESDNVDLEKQNAIIRELELPVAALVYSGGKSLHAIVKVDAVDARQYRERVDYLYKVCNKNGFEVDLANKNASRLSRMPGIIRNGKKQYLMDTNIGKSTWDEWVEWIESVNDDLPDPVNFADVWNNLPELSPPLIDGILRQGHKMLIAGPSKAGKSYALIELCCAIAEGKGWFGFNCAQGKVMYVNLELDEASCDRRLYDVYKTLGWEPKNLHNIDIWHLRGKSVPMDKLAPKLIRRAIKKNYIAIIIDPIYKVITGDENSADQMAKFCNQFDKICTELGCAVIYCHHHSKGAQGGKRSMDRASGSGVFARDPDALLDLIELDLNDDIIKQEINKATCEVCCDWLERFGLLDKVSQDDMLSESVMKKTCRELLEPNSFKLMMRAVDDAARAVQSRSAWRIEGTLREFPKFPAINMWFDYPIHRIDNVGVLSDLEADSDKPFWQKGIDKRKSKEDKKSERKESFETAFEACSFDGKVTIQKLSEYMGVSDKTVTRRIKEHGGYWIDGNEVGKKAQDRQDKN